jgi:SAM-dependent MidA family methyltransferase
LASRLERAGGSVPFQTFMAWALHDPSHGAYGNGSLRIGPSGDFATAPSLGPEFAALLAPQLADWLMALAELNAGAQPPANSVASGSPPPSAGEAAAEHPLALIEAGPGEGSLALQLAQALAEGWPALARRCELVLLEPNPGMEARQRQLLAASPLPVRWSDAAALAAAPLRGVLLAHEVLDALAVERIVQRGERWHRQRVALERGGLRWQVGEPLEAELEPQLRALGLLSPEGRANRGEGWCTELHPQLEPWLRQAAAGLEQGWLLVIDYALEAWRYYAPQRADGTLMAYRQQRAGADPLADAGRCDLTAHVCLDSLERAAAATGWRWRGSCRQGEALLALGLAARLERLQHQPDVPLPELLQRREALLRLVDPGCLGDFRWVALQGPPLAGAEAEDPPLFLRPPQPQGLQAVAAGAGG